MAGEVQNPSNIQVRLYILNAHNGRISFHIDAEAKDPKAANATADVEAAHGKVLKWLESQFASNKDAGLNWSSVGPTIHLAVDSNPQTTLDRINFVKGFTEQLCGQIGNGATVAMGHDGGRTPA